VIVKVAVSWNVKPCSLVDRTLPTSWRNPSALKVEAACSSETLVMFYETTQEYIFQKTVLFKL
jgi:hypothetical protein